MTTAYAAAAYVIVAVLVLAALNRGFRGVSASVSVG